jgi:hypothetical protein
MTHEWYVAVGGLGLQIAEPPAEDVFAGIIRTKSKNRYEIERWDGATDVRASLAAAQARLLDMVGATR